MREKFDHSKMSAEELAKTQVLNLSDVEKLASYEKATSKKPAVVLGIIGLIVLSIGIFYPKITSFFGNKKDENVVYNRVSDKDKNIDDSLNKEINNNTQLTCTKTTLANSDGTDSSLTYNFTFVNNALQNYTKLAIINVSSNSQDGLVTVDNLYAGYTSLSGVPINGYYLQTSKTSNGITVNVNIDLTKLDILSFPDTHKGNYVSNVEFNLNTTMDAVNETVSSNGFNCRESSY